MVDEHRTPAELADIFEKLIADSYNAEILGTEEEALREVVVLLRKLKGEPEVCAQCCSENITHVTEDSPVKIGQWPEVIVEHRIIRCPDCHEDFYEPDEMDRVVHKAAWELLKTASPQVEGERRIEGWLIDKLTLTQGQGEVYTVKTGPVRSYATAEPVVLTFQAPEEKDDE